MGRHLLLRPALRHNFIAQGDIYTYGNLMETKAYTINIPSEQYIKEADYYGIASGRNVDKFAAMGFTPVKSEFVNAPYISEFPLNLECKVVHVAYLDLHTQFVGEVVNVKVDSILQESDRQPLIKQIKPIISRRTIGIIMLLAGMYTTFDLSVNNLLMVREGWTIAEVRSIKVGRSICLAEAVSKKIPLAISL